jgi:hypothetical protein
VNLTEQKARKKESESSIKMGKGRKRRGRWCMVKVLLVRSLVYQTEVEWGTIFSH